MMISMMRKWLSSLETGFKTRETVRMPKRETISIDTMECCKCRKPTCLLPKNKMDKFNRNKAMCMMLDEPKGESKEDSDEGQ